MAEMPVGNSGQWGWEEELSLVNKEGIWISCRSGQAIKGAIQGKMDYRG